MFDHLLKIETLSARVSLWRGLFFVVAILLVIVASQVDYSRLRLTESWGLTGGGYIARIGIESSIGRSKSRDAALQKIENNDAVKAVLLKIDSPGGTVGDSEILYNQIRRIAKKKPVVALLGNVAASGGYMVALAADHIVAHHGTVTGSIGVLSQYVGISKIAKNLGITLKSIKTSDLKVAMSPLEEMSEDAEGVVQGIVDDFHRFFVKLVAERRSMSMEEAYKVSDGRVYTGMQALDAGLIDKIGDELAAIEWLKTHESIDEKMSVRDVEYSGHAVGGLLSSAFFSSLVKLVHMAYFE